MHIAFRTDASLQIGTGHVMRCLTLADALRERGAHCNFICRPHVGHLLDLIAERGHNVLALPALPESGAATQNTNGTFHADWLGVDWATDAAETQQILSAMMAGELLDWLVVDHYALEQRWEQILSTNAKRIMVIDDLADRHHDCDLLLDQNLGCSKQDYVALIPPSAGTLLGPKFALLRPEFAALRPQSLVRRSQNQQLQHLLITMGGVDKDNVTCQVLTTLNACTLPSELSITVVMGPHAPWLEQVREVASAMPWSTQVLVGVDNMAQLMADSDLAIGAAGSTSWERCCLGLPSLVLVLADNQKAGAEALQISGAAVALKECQQLRELFSEWLATTAIGSTLAFMSNAAASVTDGVGINYVAARMVERHCV